MTTLSPAHTLPDEIAAMHALRTLLAREQSCLSNGDTDAYVGMLEEKAALVAGLASYANERHGLLAAAGFPASEQGMQQWLGHSPEGANADWQSLMEVTRDAHELNRVNGVLLAGLAARNRQALAALGATAPGPGLYGPAGQTDYAAPRPARAAG